MSYAEVAEYYDVDICYGEIDGCEFSSFDPDPHRTGWIDKNRVIHWSPRRTTRLGLRHFLKLVARVRVMHFDRMNEATQLYAANVWATSAARELHYRLPARYSAADRRRAKYLSFRGQDLTSAARKWANNKEKQ